MSYTPLMLGGLAGVTIFLGLPLAFIPTMNVRVRGFLTAMSTGILVFLLVEITAKVIDSLEDLSLSAAGGFHTLHDTIFYGAIFAAGLFVGLMGLVWFEKRFVDTGKDEENPRDNAKKLSLMIAIGLGLHNL